jgi:hypothetical protein
LLKRENMREKGRKGGKEKVKRGEEREKMRS